jgi:predicted proteasome-type protease
MRIRNLFDLESGMEKFGSGMRKRRIRITENLNAIVKCAIISYAHLGQITFGDQGS